MQSVRLKAFAVGLCLVGLLLPSLASADSLTQCLSFTTDKTLGINVPTMYARVHTVECVYACLSAIDPAQGKAALATTCAECELIATTLHDPWPGAPSVSADGLHSAVAAECAYYAASLANQWRKELTCDKGPQNCCISTVDKGAGGKGKIEKEECYKKDPVYYGDCYCMVGNTIAPPDQNKLGRNTFQQCETECAKYPNGRVDYSQGIGRYKAESEGMPEQPYNVNALCFKPEDCKAAMGDYSGNDTACPDGQGKCWAPEPSIQLSSSISSQIQVQGIRGYLTLILNFALMAALIAAAVMFIFGGFKYILSSSFMEIGTAKQTLLNSIIGMILALSALALLRTVNPSLTYFTQLRIPMVNKLQFAPFNWCEDYKSSRPGKPLMFGDSGDPAGNIPYDQTKFEIQQTDALCGKEYYAEGFIGKRCDGRVCKDKGKACFPCQEGSDLEECGEKTKGFACVQSVIGGAIRWTEGNFPQKVQLIAVCNYAQGSDMTFDWVKKQAPTFFSTTIAGDNSGNAGGVSYIYKGSASDLAKMQASCASNGGLRGVLLGVVYKDSSERMLRDAIMGLSTGLAGAAVGAIAGSAKDDILIVSKTDCGNTGSAYFSGYADGTATSKDTTDMITALYCGSIMLPGGGGMVRVTGVNPVLTPSAMWTPDELKAAYSGDKPINCDFTLSKMSAPQDPGTALMTNSSNGKTTTCTASFCLPGSASCK